MVCAIEMPRFDLRWQKLFWNNSALQRDGKRKPNSNDTQGTKLQLLFLPPFSIKFNGEKETYLSHYL